MTGYPSLSLRCLNNLQKIMILMRKKFTNLLGFHNFKENFSEICSEKI